MPVSKESHFSTDDSFLWAINLISVNKVALKDNSVAKGTSVSRKAIM